jgi:hypothetical protein
MGNKDCLYCQVLAHFESRYLESSKDSTTWLLAASRTAQEFGEILFPYRLIWRSRDLTGRQYLVIARPSPVLPCGYLKSRVFETRPATLRGLKANIMDVSHDCYNAWCMIPLTKRPREGMTAEGVGGIHSIRFFEKCTVLSDLISESSVVPLRCSNGAALRPVLLFL